MVGVVINTVDTVAHEAAGHIHLAADNGLDARSLGSLVKINTAVHDAVISQGNGILPQFLHTVHHAADAAETIQKAVF